MTVLEDFAAEVGVAGPVTCVGGRTQWEAGGALSGPAREVAAPTGVVAHEPGEMIVRVRAGTTLAELDAIVAAGGQMVTIEADHPDRATVGGVLACGRSGRRRLGWGPVRDTVLEVTAVDSTGTLVRAGAPLVKNVTGFDLVRLLVGSVGTLAFIAEVVLRCRPRPEVEKWWVAEEVDPFDVLRSLYRPSAVLWDGTRTWVSLSGYAEDVDAQAATVLGDRFSLVPRPPDLPGRARRSLAPGELSRLAAVAGPPGTWLAEIGVGMVYGTEPSLAGVAVPAPSDVVMDLHRAVKERFDPDGRMNPGRAPWSRPLTGGVRA